MNEFTLMLLVAAVALVALIVTHLHAQRARIGLYAQATDDAEVDALFDHIEAGMAEYDANVKAEYDEALRVLGSLCRDMEGMEYIDCYQEFMMDWVAFGEQEPCAGGLRSLRSIVERAQICANAIRIERERQKEYEADMARLRTAIYMESVYGVDDGRDHCEHDDMHHGVPSTEAKFYWFTGECIFEVCDEGRLLCMRDELLGEIYMAQGNDVYLIKVAAEDVWLAEHYVEDENLTPLEVYTGSQGGIELYGWVEGGEV